MKIARFNENIELSNEFDKIVDIFIEFADDGCDLKFRTACGHQVSMSYDDYTSKNKNYHEFMDALPIMGIFFDISIHTNYNYDKFIDMSKEFQASLLRIREYNWNLKEFKSHVFSDHTSKEVNKLSFEFSFKHITYNR